MRQIQKISQREREVLELISLSYSTSEIAAQLYISPETAKTHRKNLLTKLDAGNAAGLIRKAFEMGLLKLENEYRLEMAS